MRLPDFLTRLSPVGETLASMEQGEALLSVALEQQHKELFISSATTGLALWEKDYSLPSAGEDAARRTRIRNALAGAATLTVAELKQLAITLGGADNSEVTERFPLQQVILSALYDEEAPEDLSALEEAIARRKPAHLEVLVQTVLPEREIFYYGTATPLSAARTCICAGTAGDKYALFAGGGGYVYATDAYDKQLTRTIAPSLAQYHEIGAGASVGNYFVLGGGNSDNVTGTEAYDETLTRRGIGPVIPRMYIGGASTRHHALIGSGYSGGTADGTVTAFDENLVSSFPSGYRGGGFYGIGSFNGGVLFAGGQATFGDGITYYYPYVDFFDEFLSVRTAADLSYQSVYSSVVSTDSYALVAGGCYYNGRIRDCLNVTAYSQDLTRVTAENLSVARANSYSASFGGKAMIAGGGQSAAVDCYDDTLTHSLLTELSVGRESGGATSRRGVVIGNYALFAGGNAGSSVSNVVDAYVLI